MFLPDELSGFLARLAFDSPDRLDVEDGELTLTAAARGYSIPFATLCRESLDGRLPVVGRIEGSGLSGLIVRRSDVRELRRRRWPTSDKKQSRALEGSRVSVESPGA